MKKRFMVTLEIDVMHRFQSAVDALNLGLGCGAASAMLNDLLKTEIVPMLEKTVALQKSGALNRLSLLDMLAETTERLDTLKTEMEETNYEKSC